MEGRREYVPPQINFMRFPPIFWFRMYGIPPYISCHYHNSDTLHFCTLGRTSIHQRTRPAPRAFPPCFLPSSCNTNPMARGSLKIADRPFPSPLPNL